MMLEKEASLADETAFNDFVQSHYATLMRTAMHITRHQQSAEDIVQEAFLILWKNRIRIIPANIGGWLHTVTTHLAYKHIKKETRRNNIHATLSNAKQSWHTHVEEHLLQKESRNTYVTAYLRLPERQQIVYRLSREEGLSRDEIACQLSISPNTVKNHLLKSIQFMKDHIQTCGLFLILFVFYNLFFISNSTKSPLKDLYNRGQKGNIKSQIEKVHAIMYSKSLMQHVFYFKNTASLSPIRQCLGYTRYQYRN